MQESCAFLKLYLKIKFLLNWQRKGNPEKKALLVFFLSEFSSLAGQKGARVRRAWNISPSSALATCVSRSAVTSIIPFTVAMESVTSLLAEMLLESAQVASAHYPAHWFLAKLLVQLCRKLGQEIYPDEKQHTLYRRWGEKDTVIFQPDQLPR